jgi:membrane-associated phospholipid phosphatase
MFKTLATVALLCASLPTHVMGLSVATKDAVSATSNGVPNQVIQWNKTLLVILRTPNSQPANLHPTRSYAMLHVAIYDAVDAIDGGNALYRVAPPFVSPRASKEAAAAVAAHDVLSTLYPSFQSQLDAQLQQALSEIPASKNKDDGISIGKIVAAQIVALRVHDGDDPTLAPYVPSGDPGNYQLTPPNFAPAQFTQWAKITPWALSKSSQFRPGPPPALSSDEYTSVYSEVKSIGFIDSTTRTQEQTVIAKFWNGNIQNYWNEITQTAALSHQLNLTDSARLFALVNLSLADSVIAFYDAKYVYQFWRPVTAIREAADDGNPNTDPDPNWLPLNTKTAPDPSYPGAHSAISFAGAEVLGSFFGDQFDFSVTSEVLPGVVRDFHAFSAAAEEAGLSRIYAGQHFRSDHVAGRDLGGNVGNLIFKSLLLPRQPLI